jgi:hypothetical protein
MGSGDIDAPGTVLKKEDDPWHCSDHQERRKMRKKLAVVMLAEKSARLQHFSFNPGVVHSWAFYLMA